MKKRECRPPNTFSRMIYLKPLLLTYLLHLPRFFFSHLSSSLTLSFSLLPTITFFLPSFSLFSSQLPPLPARRSATATIHKCSTTHQRHTCLSFFPSLFAFPTPPPSLSLVCPSQSQLLFSVAIPFLGTLILSF